MKKLVPDPPRILSSYFTIHTDLDTSDALAHASELLCGLIETLDEHCRLHTGEPGLNLIGNATHAATMARALVEHALACLDASREVEHE